MKSTSAQPKTPTKSKRQPGVRFATGDHPKSPRDAIVVGPDGVDQISVSLSIDTCKIELEAIRRVIASSNLLVANDKTAPSEDVEPPPLRGKRRRHLKGDNDKGTQDQAQSVREPAPASLSVNQVLIRALVSGVGIVGGGHRRAFNTDGVQQLLRYLIETTDSTSRHAVLDAIEALLTEYRSTVATVAFDATEVVVQRLRQQSAASRADDVRAGRLIQGKELAERLHLVRQSISAGLKSNRLFAFRLEHGRLYYPAFFADEQYDRSVLEAVSKDLGNLSAGSKWDFFMGARHSLQGKTPLEALKTGQLNAVRRAAQAFTES